MTFTLNRCLAVVKKVLYFKVNDILQFVSFYGDFNQRSVCRSFRRVRHSITPAARWQTVQPSRLRSHPVLTQRQSGIPYRYWNPTNRTPRVSFLANMVFSNDILITVADPGFPVRGGANPREGANIRFCQICPNIAWNWKNLHSGRGGACQNSYYVDPPLIVIQLFLLF